MERTSSKHLSSEPGFFIFLQGRDRTEPSMNPTGRTRNVNEV